MVAAHHAHGRRDTIPDLGEGVMSENGTYFLPDDNDGEIIYVADHPPRGSALIRPQQLPSVQHNGRTYHPYRSASRAPNEKFVCDCLHTAEELMRDAVLIKGNVYSRVAGTLEDFGVNEANNIRAANARPLDGNAAPRLGQAYVIVNTAWRGGAPSPYHAAAVVAEDGGDRVTLEVFATQSEPKRTERYGTYRIYPTRPGDPDNFHNYWTTTYFHNNVHTIVIELK
jgi:hypothetical protein